MTSSYLLQICYKIQVTITEISNVYLLYTVQFLLHFQTVTQQNIHHINSLINTHDGFLNGFVSFRVQIWLILSDLSLHYHDVIMSTMASLITSLTIVYSTVYLGVDQRKHQSSALLAFVREFTGDGEFPAQMASNAENVSIWWRHHGPLECYT